MIEKQETYQQDTAASFILRGLKHSILKAAEEKRMGRSLELDRYLNKLEEKYSNPVDINLELRHRCDGLKLVADALATIIKSMQGQSEPEQFKNPIMRQIIDGPIDEHISSMMAEKMQMNQEEAVRSLIEFSIVSRLICLDENTADRYSLIHQAAKIARDTLVTSNQKLVISVAKKYIRSRLPLEDLIQEGNLGLIIAVDKYDHRRNYKISTYATWWIRQRIDRYIKDSSRNIRIPVHTLTAIIKMKTIYSKFYQKAGRKPTNCEIAAEMGITENELNRIQSADYIDTVSLETPVGEEDDILADCIADENALNPEEEAENTMVKGKVEEALNCLDERQRQVIKLRFGLEDGRCWPLREVAHKLNISAEMVRVIEGKALRNIRKVAGRLGLEYC